MNKALLSTVGVVVILVVAFVVLRPRTSPEEPAVPPTPVTAPEAATTPEEPPAAGGPAVALTEVSIGATGFTPATATIPVGSAVRFTNADTESHQVASNPHPVHTNFPELNGPVLVSGASHTVVFEQVGSFGYHDHLNPGVTGTVVVQ